MSYLDQSVAQLKVFEGVVPWMYLDGERLVTVGVGKMLPSPADACMLPFRNDRGGAWDDEVVADYRRVAGMKPGMVAAAYYVEGCVTLAPADISALLMKTVTDFDVALHGLFVGFDDFPEPAKVALLDMIYNLGLHGLTAYRNLRSAIASWTWTEAAAECHRRGPSQARNDWTMEQFLEAASEVQKATSGGTI